MLRLGQVRDGQFSQAAIRMIHLLDESGRYVGLVSISNFLDGEPARGWVWRLQERQPITQVAVCDGDILENHQGRGGHSKICLGRAGEQALDFLSLRRARQDTERLQGASA